LGVLLGIVQGISEWLPISSKTQVIIASSYLFGLTFEEGYALGLFLEAGTFIAAIVYFRVQVYGVLKALIGRGDQEDRTLLKFLVIATAVTAVLGVVIYKVVSESVTGPALGIPMIILGCILIGDGILITLARGRRTPTKGLADLKNRDIVIIGIAQGIAAFPGVSRSGATVSAMLLMGVKPEDSFKLSFLALIPASVGAAGVTVLLSGVKLGVVVDVLTLPVILLSILVTIAIGLVLIRTLLRFAGSSRIALLTLALGALAIFSGITSIYFGAG
jgi:undecaprenyl-diphosphatase